MCNCKVPSSMRTASPVWDFATGPLVVMDDGTIICEQCRKVNGRVSARTEEFYDDDKRFYE